MLSFEGKIGFLIPKLVYENVKREKGVFGMAF